MADAGRIDRRGEATMFNVSTLASIIYGAAAGGREGWLMSSPPSGERDVDLHARERVAGLSVRVRAVVVDEPHAAHASRAQHPKKPGDSASTAPPERALPSQ